MAVKTGDHIEKEEDERKKKDKKRREGTRWAQPLQSGKAIPFCPSSRCCSW